MWVFPLPHSYNSAVILMNWHYIKKKPSLSSFDITIECTKHWFNPKSVTFYTLFQKTREEEFQFPKSPLPLDTPILMAYMFLCLFFYLQIHLYTLCVHTPTKMKFVVGFMIFSLVFTATLGHNGFRQIIRLDAKAKLPMERENNLEQAKVLRLSPSETNDPIRKEWEGFHPDLSRIGWFKSLWFK